MTSGQVKGSLLEFIVRTLMQDCGFASVRPDGHYIFEQNGTGLFFINGKGAAHDADVLMEPPIQMPFSYPSRLLFECKSYSRTIGLDVIRNALGLRYDINEFEIITEDSITLRKNNLRAQYAISDRKRYYYQIGVASVEEFTRSAFEFAANNKIPLLSLRWFLSRSTCDLFHEITKDYVTGMPEDIRSLLYIYLKDKTAEARQNSFYERLFEYLKIDIVIGRILREFQSTVDNFMIGLLETGDLLFLFSRQSGSKNYISEIQSQGNNEAKIHYHLDNPTRWTLSIRNNSERNPIEFDFNVPYSLLNQWRQFNFNKTVGYNIKSEYFSRIFLFFSRFSSYGLPFALVNLDSQWLDELRFGNNDPEGIQF